METLTGDAVDSITNVYHTEHVSDAVVGAVAQAKGVDPLDLDPLYDVVDPDALDALFRSTDAGRSDALELHFTMAGCEVVVRGEGEVVVTPVDDDSSAVVGRLDE